MQFLYATNDDMMYAVIMLAPATEQFWDTMGKPQGEQRRLAHQASSGEILETALFKCCRSRLEGHIYLKYAIRCKSRDLVATRHLQEVFKEGPRGYRHSPIPSCCEK
jgi:hypothetical protein